MNSAAELASYDQIKTSMKRADIMQEGAPLHLFSAACAGIIAAVVCSPADVVKSRMQDGITLETGEKVPYKNMNECISRTFRHHGLGGFYKGFHANCQNLVVFNCSLFMIREQILKFYELKGMK